MQLKNILGTGALVQLVDILRGNINAALWRLERGYGQVRSVRHFPPNAQLQNEQIFPNQLWVLNEGLRGKNFLKWNAVFSDAIGERRRGAAEDGNL